MMEDQTVHPVIQPAKDLLLCAPQSAVAGVGVQWDWFWMRKQGPALEF